MALRLVDVIQPGDWLLIYPKEGQLLGKIIKKLTFGEVTHAALVLDKDTLFETDGDMFTAKYSSPEKYAGRRLIIVSCNSLRGREHDIKVRCEVYRGAPYSYWDIATNAIFFWLAVPLKRKLVSFLGTKKFMLCSELVARIAYDVGKREELRCYEGLTPEDLRDIAKEYPDEYDYLECNAK